MTPALDRVIVGNGGAAAAAVLALRASGFRGRVDLFSDGGLPPYNPMLGPFYVGGAIGRTACFPFGDGLFYRRNRVHAHHKAAVVRLDPEARTFETADGVRRSYRECLVATGSSTALPPVPGLAGRGVFALRSFGDAERLRAALAAAGSKAARGGPARALVLGASLGGIEVAGVARRAGLAVTVVERERQVLPGLAHPIGAGAVQRHLRDAGYELLLGTMLEDVERAHGRLHIRLRALASSQGPPAAGPAPGVGAAGDAPDETVDLIVVCTGSRPNLDFLAGSGLAGPSGLDVDEHMRTAAPGLLAAGDVARTVDRTTGVRRVVARWSSARRQGRAAGLTMGGVEAACPPEDVCAIQRTGDLMFAAAGSFSDADAVELDEHDGSLAVLGFSGRRLVGFNLLGDTRRAGPLAGALGSPPDDGAASSRGTASALAAAREAMTWTTRHAG